MSKASGLMADIEARMEEYEDRIEEGAPADIRSEIAAIRRQIAQVRRYLAPQRDALDSLHRIGSKLLDEEQLFAVREQCDRIMRYIEEGTRFGFVREFQMRVEDPDNDGLRNYIEFALHTDPNVPNGDFNPLQISLDEDDHPIIVYQRHVAAANFYNFDIETSPDGDQWERLVDIEVLQINDISDTALMIESRSNVSVINLDAAYYRLRITPR